SRVGGSRRTRRVPYLVCQSSLIGASQIDRRYLGTHMLHCNMKTSWQCCHARKLRLEEPKLPILDLTRFLHANRSPLRLKTLLELIHRCCVVDFDGRGGSRERLQRAHEVA